MRAGRLGRRASSLGAGSLVLLGVLAVPSPAAAAAADVHHDVAVTVALATPPGSEADGTTVQKVVDAVEVPGADSWWGEGASASVSSPGTPG